MALDIWHLPAGDCVRGNDKAATRFRQPHQMPGTGRFTTRDGASNLSCSLLLIGQKEADLDQSSLELKMGDSDWLSWTHKTRNKRAWTRVNEWVKRRYKDRRDLIKERRWSHFPRRAPVLSPQTTTISLSQANLLAFPLLLFSHTPSVINHQHSFRDLSISQSLFLSCYANTTFTPFCRTTIICQDSIGICFWKAEVDSHLPV